MTLWLKILIFILALHYVLAIAVLVLVLKDNLKVGGKTKRTPLICWNLTVLFLPILGPIVYLIYRIIAKPQIQQTNTLQSESTIDKQEHTPNLQDKPTTEPVNTDTVVDTPNTENKDTNTEISPKSEDK